MGVMTRVRDRAKSAARATKKTAARASKALPTGGSVREPKEESGRGIVRKAQRGRTGIQKAASQARKPRAVNGQLQASDADVLRIADVIAKQRKQLMDRLAQ